MSYNTDEPPTKLRCRCLVPFAFVRSAESYVNPETALRNAWAFVSVKLCVDADSDTQRLILTRKVTQGIKKRLQPLVNFLSTTLSSRISLWLTRLLAWNSYSRHSFIFANVPGPPAKAKFCGEEIDHFLVLFANLLPQVEVLSYAGRVYFTLAADPTIIPHPADVTHFFV
eukprot:CAMPEP_0113853580 /NCGR_PEP_ID=MMETSP0372-20130328/6516_1 /TAXON_ID=340204 /ORGANISM="Lankesteria abbotti" /LENGTH=169 /DNA_ID=CAMNT_0000825999 /DNA_START=36 /DNA_END=541 /DNA_ORIENTATION=- /assembly_acc=CAM_ASM_000359